MTVNHWVPGSSPGRGAKFKSPDACRGFLVSAAGLSPGTASQVIRPCGPHPFGAALKRVRLTPSSPGRGAKFKSPDACRGFFVLGPQRFSGRQAPPHRRDGGQEKALPALLRFQNQTAAGDSTPLADVKPAPQGLAASPPSRTHDKAGPGAGFRLPQSPYFTLSL